MLDSAQRRPSRFVLLGALGLACLAAPGAAQKSIPVAQPGPQVVGTSAPIKLEPDLAQSFENAGTLLWGDALTVPGASFLKAHLVDVNLRSGDVLVLRSASGHVVDEIRGRGPKDMGTFWALSAFGEELELEFRFHAPYERAPF